MSTIELIFNQNQSADLSNELKFILDKVVSEFRDPLKKTGIKSQPLTLPYTEKNNAIFFHEQDKQVLGKFRRTYPVRLVKNGQTLVTGEFLHQANGGSGFEGAVGERGQGSVTLKLGDLLGTKKLKELKSLTPIDFTGHAYVVDSWNNTVAYPDAEICFPYVLPSLSHLKTGKVTHYEDLGISHFAAAVLKAVFADAGYQVEGDIFTNATFQKLVLLYSDGGDQKWNYGRLLPMSATCPLSFLGNSGEGVVDKIIDRDTDYVFVMSYPFQAGSGDAAGCLDDGVYSSKFSGLYTMSIRAEVVTTKITTEVQPSTSFAVLRSIGGNEYIPDQLLPQAGTFDTAPVLAQLDRDTLLVGGTAGEALEGTVRLQADQQYVVQRYVSIPKSAGAANTFFLYNPDGGQWNITDVNAPLALNPALFLPDLAQTEFVDAVFKLFNLYYLLNQNEKVVTLVTRDDFFQETISDVVDLTPYLDVNDLRETPLSAKEIGQTYLNWAGDDADLLLKQTDYMSDVNGIQPEESTKLPFAPLGFLRVPFNLGTLDTPNVGFDLIPAILPPSDADDASLLDDTNAVTAGGSWVPRLCLYHGNNWLTEQSAFKVSMGKYIAPVPDFIGGYTPGYYEFLTLPPKLGFFDYSHQPAFEVVEDTTLRTFALVKSVNETIYANPNEFFLVNTATADLDAVSLATNINDDVNPRGFFFQLYSNDLLIGNLSHYLEGVGRMNETLFQRLTGRQVLRLSSDLYLLESIKNFDLNRNSAQYKIYKLVANSGAAGVDLVRYTSTQTHTATCGTGLIGTVTKAATRSSYISIEDAVNKAAISARELAESLLICYVDTSQQTWTRTATHVATCGGGYTGNDSAGTGTYTSSISEQDAINQATALAVADAESRLQCDLIE
ncbi:hypothetical protein I2I05_08580 [Hymenobacter sp. BT683]|uniref:Virion structural protein n=1 Tax=Hymenobacter jeongseonensis TaxID=2791027 RepID=A0ABS0IGF7_9BACT|nr:hypothetical protein [Hymenobacter jeongseonensis]MBF9237452.1 hypothetical protein [Hymenobacter jeongseonensis]